MKKLILLVSCIFLLFGCAIESSDNNQSAVNSGLNENNNSSNPSGNNGGSSGDSSISGIETGDTGGINSGSINQGDTNTDGENTDEPNTDTDSENTNNPNTDTSSDNTDKPNTDTDSDNTDKPNTDTGSDDTDKPNTDTGSGSTDKPDTDTGSDNTDNTNTDNQQTNNKDNETNQDDTNEGSLENNKTNYILYSIASHIPQTPTDTLPANVTYSLTGSTASNLTMQKYIEDNSLFDNDNVSRNIIKSQININNIVKEKNIKPISKNNNALYKTLPNTINTGTKWNNVWVMDVTTSQQYLTNATCIYVSDNVYYFLDDRVSTASIDINRVKEIDEKFAAAYQKVHEKCGHENDVDANGKIVFLFTPIGSNVLGFFYTADKYSDASILSSGVRSNESDMMYIESDYLQKNISWELNKDSLLSTLTHEFHHMALFDVRLNAGKEPFMDYWINEGLSTLTAYYTGYPATMRDHLLNFFAYELDKPLVNNTQDLSYGYSYLFMRYFYYRFGDTGIQKLINSQYLGYQAVEEASGMNFNNLYKDFLKMILVTGRNVTDDPIYNVPEFNNKENTQEYLSSYISLAEMLDIFIDTPPFTDIYTTYTGYVKQNAVPYTFQYKKWLTTPDNLTLQGTNTTVFYSQF
ncbi:MAG: hypothetical protein SPF17_01945 [Candidatus Mucispirillum faecigallinarum]|nr:hypothetical protein [Candidatus Mucispirillum faecigallinarum]